MWRGQSSDQFHRSLPLHAAVEAWLRAGQRSTKSEPLVVDRVALALICWKTETLIHRSGRQGSYQRSRGCSVSWRGACARLSHLLRSAAELVASGARTRLRGRRPAWPSLNPRLLGSSRSPQFMTGL